MRSFFFSFFLLFSFFFFSTVPVKQQRTNFWKNRGSAGLRPSTSASFCPFFPSQVQFLPGGYCTMVPMEHCSLFWFFLWDEKKGQKIVKRRILIYGVSTEYFVVFLIWSRAPKSSSTIIWRMNWISSSSVAWLAMYVRCKY